MSGAEQTGGEDQLEVTPLNSGRRSRRWADQGFRLLTLAAGLLILVILVLIAVTATQKAWPAFREAGFGYFTSRKWIPNEDKFGALRVAATSRRRSFITAWRGSVS